MGNRQSILAGLLLPAYGVLLLCVFVPLCALLYFSAQDNMPGPGVVPHLTTANYTVLVQSLYLGLLVQSLGISVLVPALCAVIGWPAADAARPVFMCWTMLSPDRSGDAGSLAE